MSIAKRILMILAVTTLVIQLPGCGQQRPSGGTTQQPGSTGSKQQKGNGKSDTAQNKTTKPQDTVSDTSR